MQIRVNFSSQGQGPYSVWDLTLSAHTYVVDRARCQREHLKQGCAFFDPRTCVHCRTLDQHEAVYTILNTAKRTHLIQTQVQRRCHTIHIREHCNENTLIQTIVRMWIVAHWINTMPYILNIEHCKC